MRSPKLSLKTFQGYETGGLTFDDFTFNTPPLRIDIQSPRISGSLNGTTQKALVGADIKLQATPSFSGGSYSWTFTGPAVIVGGSASSSSVTIRSTNVGNIVAKMSYAQGGSIVSETVNINAILPSLSSYSAQQESDILITTDAPGPCIGMIPGRVTWLMGCLPFAEGITFNATAVISSGPYLTDPAQSGVKYVQAVSAMRKARFNSGTMECLTGRTAEDNVGSGRSLDDNPTTGDGDPSDSSPSALPEVL